MQEDFMSDYTTQSIPQRRRGAALEKALLDAAWAELKAVGYTQLTYDAVAERAGTSRPILYRRWPHKHELILAAMRNHAPMLSGPIPDTGSLRGDVIQLLEGIARRLQVLGQDVMWGLLSDIIADSDMSSQVFRTSNVGKETMTTILKRAGERGEIDFKVVPERVITLPVDLFRHEVITTGKPPTRAAIGQIVDEIFMPLIMHYSI
jgi:AcrR family transcriptional regulator